MKGKREREKKEEIQEKWKNTEICSQTNIESNDHPLMMKTR